MGQKTMKNKEIDEKELNWIKELEKDSVKGIVLRANQVLRNSYSGKSEERLEKLEQFL